MHSPIKLLKEILSEDLNQVNELLLSSLQPIHVPQIIEYAKYLFNAGGKRLRPLLTLTIARALNYQGSKHIQLACAIELIHTATLLHDDVIDLSDKRRGNITVNNKWGNNTAILLGDHLFAHSFLQMVNSGSMACLESLSNAAKIITEGEILQLSLLNNPHIEEKLCWQVIEAKTASLFAVACEVGGIISQSDKHIIESLKSFGYNFGIAFQIRDDLLDIIGQHEKTGKQIGDDLKEGKVTLVTKIALKELAKQDADHLCKIIKDPVTFKNDIYPMVKLMNNPQIIAKINRLCHDHYIKAKEFLQIIPHSKIKDILINMCEQQSQRIN